MKHKAGKEKPDITVENGWEFICVTPSGGKEYYNKNIPSIAIVYNNVINIYTKIKHMPIARLPWPIDFSVCTYYES